MVRRTQSVQGCRRTSLPTERLQPSCLPGSDDELTTRSKHGASGRSPPSETAEDPDLPRAPSSFTRSAHARMVETFAPRETLERRFHVKHRPSDPPKGAV